MKRSMLDLIMTRSSDDIIRNLCVNDGLPSDHRGILLNLNGSRSPANRTNCGGLRLTAPTGIVPDCFKSVFICPLFEETCFRF